MADATFQKVQPESAAMRIGLDVSAIATAIAQELVDAEAETRSSAIAVIAAQLAGGLPNVAAGLFIRPEWFGAEGDDETDDHDAFRALGDLCATLGHARIELTAGKTYRLGKQYPNVIDENGNGPYYRANENALRLHGLSSVIIRGNGATLKFNDGLLFGAFNTTTGLAENQAVKNNAKNAHPGWLIDIEDCDSVEISDLTLDGNSMGLVPGGDTQTNYFEARHTGIRIDSFDSLKLRNVEAFGFLQDGIAQLFAARGLTEADTPKPSQMENVRVHDCGRNNIWIGGGNQTDVVGLASWNAGAAPTTAGNKGTAPFSALDLESEVNTINHNVTVRRSHIEQGPNGRTALAMDTGSVENIAYRDTTIIGNVRSVYPRVVFDNCDIFGWLERITSNQGDPAANPLFTNTRISDGTAGSTPEMAGSAGLLIGNTSPAAKGARFHECTFDLSRFKANFQDIETIDCRVVARWTTATQASGSTVIQLKTSGKHTRLAIIDAILSSAPASAYVVEVDAGVEVRQASISAYSSRSGGNLTSGSPNVTGIITDGLRPGMTIAGTGVPGGTTILSITGGTSLVMSANATSTTPSQLTFASPLTGNVKWLASGASGHVGSFDNMSGTRIGSATNGDAAVTLYPRASARNQLFTAPLTAARTVSVNTTGAGAGDMYRIVRTAAATGAFNLNIGTGPLKQLTAAGQWAEVTYDGAAWALTASGTL